VLGQSSLSNSTSVSKIPWPKIIYKNLLEILSAIVSNINTLLYLFINFEINKINHKLFVQNSIFLHQTATKTTLLWNIPLKMRVVILKSKNLKMIMIKINKNIFIF